MQNKMFPVRRRGHIGQRSEPDPGRRMRWLLADRRRSQGLIRAGVREDDSQPTSAFLSARLPANVSSRRELGATVGRVVVTASITYCASSNTATAGPACLCYCMLQRRHQRALQLVATAASTAAGLGDSAVTVRETEGVRGGRYGLQRVQCQACSWLPACQSKTP